MKQPAQALRHVCLCSTHKHDCYNLILITLFVPSNVCACSLLFVISFIYVRERVFLPPSAALPLVVRCVWSSPAGYLRVSLALYRKAPQTAYNRLAGHGSKPYFGLVTATPDAMHQPTPRFTNTHLPIVPVNAFEQLILPSSIRITKCRCNSNKPNSNS
jgi:hypothetical protein